MSVPDGFPAGAFPLAAPSQETLDSLRDRFRGLMSALYAESGSSLRISILANPAAQSFINSHAATLDSAFQTVPMSDAMRERLQRSDYIFSGIKTFHELNEAFPSLLDENGNRKPFERFLNDVQNIDKTYNRNYLRAEYNFVASSAIAAAKWEQFAQDGDRYNLQYRTAQDDRVREEHAALHGVTLPPSDSFWESYYPPNGWNCRCTVVQVRKSKHHATSHDEAMALGEAATATDKRGIFRFNPGIQQQTFPDYNPYTISRCRTCPIAKDSPSLSHPPSSLSQAPLSGVAHICASHNPNSVPGGFPAEVSSLAADIPASDLCAACRLIHKLAKEQNQAEVSRSKIKAAQKDLVNWYKRILKPAKAGKFDAKRLEIRDENDTPIIINKNFYQEIINKYKDDPLYPLKLQYAKQAHELLKTAKLIDPAEQSTDHPDATFRVYEYIDDCYKVEMKVKCNRDGNILYYLRIYKR